jgi:ankyrin repeat protein
VESWRLQRPRSPLFAAPFVFSLADAIETGELPQAHQFLRDRDDPSAPIEVRHPVLTADKSVTVSPLLWAVATQNREAVQMLLGLGARMDRGADRKAACLAQALGNDDLAGLLRTYGAPSDEPCAAADAGVPPLLTVVGANTD